MAKVKLRHLKFDTLLTLFDSSNVSRLVNIFKLDGCARLDPDHHVPAVIDENQLKSALGQSRASEADLLKPLQTEPPELFFPSDFTLTCLHGQHHIAAAREFLLPRDQWWIVDLYVSSISENTRRHIHEEYSNSRKFSDGDISTFATTTDMKTMKQLQKTSWLAAVLDPLLIYPGLWPDLQLGSVPTILSWKCPQEVSNYLEGVRKTWSAITCHDESIAPFVDESTVELLQSLAPSSCSGYRNSAQTLMETRKVFPKLRDSALRSNVLGQLLSIKGMVFSLHTFFEDTKCLEPVVTVLRGLLPPNFEGPIRDAIIKRYTGISQQDGQYYVGHGEDDTRLAPGGEAYGIYFGYRQLCLYAMRHFPSMTNISPRIGKKSRREKPPGESNQRMNPISLWHKLAKLAHTLGFDSEEIQRLLPENADEDMVRNSLHKHRPEEYYEIDHNVFEAEVQRQCEALKKFKRRRLDPSTPKISVDFGGLPISERCGKPDEDSHDFDKKYLFLPSLCELEEDRTPKRDITSFAVKRLIFFAFFGDNFPPDGQRIQNNTEYAVPSEQCVQNNIENTVSSEQRGNPSSTDGSPAITGVPAVEESNAREARPETRQALRLPASTGNDSDTVMRDRARFRPRPHINRKFGNIEEAIKGVSRICLQENGVAFFQIQTKEHTTSENNHQSVYQMAAKISEGCFNHIKISRPQKFGYVEAGRMAAVKVEEVYDVANREGMDYPRVIILVDASKGSSEVQAFGMEFSKFCSAASSSRSAENRKRTVIHQDPSAKEYRQRGDCLLV